MTAWRFLTCCCMLQAPQLDAARAHVMDKVEAQRFGVSVRHGGSLVYKGLI